MLIHAENHGETVNVEGSFHDRVVSCCPLLKWLRENFECGLDYIRFLEMSSSLIADPAKILSLIEELCDLPYTEVQRRLNRYVRIFIIIYNRMQNCISPRWSDLWMIGNGTSFRAGWPIVTHREWLSSARRPANFFFFTNMQLNLRLYIISTIISMSFINFILFIFF